MRPLDVLAVMPSLERGGAERVIVNHLNGLHGAGVRARLLLLGGRPDGPLRTELDADIDVAALVQERIRSALGPLVRHVRDDPPDVLLATHTHVNLALCAARPVLPRSTRLVLREPTHAPVLLDGHSTRARRLAQRALYRRADLILATSSAMRDDLRRLAGERVTLLANPVRVDAIRATTGEAAVTRPRAGRRFVSVGRLDSQKSLPDLIAAFASGSRADDELVLVGDGPMREEVLAIAETLGVADRVRLTGDLVAPWAEVAAADVFLLASRAEGMPNAALEALAVGTPVIATDELEVLEDVRAEAPSGALLLVPRSALGDAVRDFAAPPDGALPRASLLPARFEAAAATRELHAQLVQLVRIRAGT
jgi:glycosyltransferase involved in cell wall biosynthesis